MIAGRPASILRQLEAPAAPDGELLALFVRDRDQFAFAELVRRHSALVLGVAQRVTGHRQDAEDVFQAVFLVLAQKAGRIQKPALLGNWLHGVALRVGQKARRTASRRRVRETAVCNMPEQATPPPSIAEDLGPVLDEELAALPAWYRDAVILCDLRGVSRSEAAAALGVPEGTLSSRLAAGRKKLATRLRRRGVTLSVVAIPGTLSAAQAAVVVPGVLLTNTCKLVADFLAGETLPRPLLKLAEGGVSVRKSLILVVASSAALAAGMVYATQPGREPPETAPPAVIAAKQEPKDGPKADERKEPAAAGFTSKPRLIDTRDIAISNATSFVWNPQGTRYAVTFTDPVAWTVHVVSLDTFPHPVWRMHKAKPWHFLGFAPDGEKLVLERREYDLVSGLHELSFWKPRPDTNDFVLDRTVNLGPEETQGYAFSADGKTFRTVAIERNSGTRAIERVTVQEMDAETGKLLKSLLTVNCSSFALARNGKRLAVLLDYSIEVYDVDRAAKQWSFPLPHVELPPQVLSKGSQRGRVLKVELEFCADSQRLLVAWQLLWDRQVNPGGAGPTSSRLNGEAGPTLVLDVETGKPLADLESKAPQVFLASNPARDAMTRDGRLLVLSGMRYVVSEQKAAEVNQPYKSVRPFLTVWDTKTGKPLKTWNQQVPIVALNPVRPLLAIVEHNGEATRIGFWDFSAEMGDKK
jgi:RNA polymerase sigma factor (sigma-70 family)